MGLPSKTALLDRIREPQELRALPKSDLRQVADDLTAARRASNEHERKETTMHTAPRSRDCIIIRISYLLWVTRVAYFGFVYMVAALAVPVAAAATGTGFHLFAGRLYRHAL